MSKRKVVFVKNVKALKYFSGSSNCAFLEEKIEEGYKPVCYDFKAGGFYFLEPEPILSYNLVKEYYIIGRGIIHIVTNTEKSLSINQEILLNRRKFKIDSIEKQRGSTEIGLRGRFLD